MNEGTQTSIVSQVTQFADNLYPRILTQVCRDPSSSSFGCFDRNWWHYKIRDFPSIILQQGALALAEYSKFDKYSSHKESLHSLVRGSGNFWNQRSIRHGAFEEYYPWEQGYPPAAFSTLAVLRSVDCGIVSLSEVFPGLQKASIVLKKRFESEAANQQVAGLAALALIRKLAPALVSQSEWSEIAEKTLGLQRTSGWYEEYGGPDLGYLSVTIDCLWDIWDATKDERFLKSASKALAFIDIFTTIFRGNIGMHNSRNTDYIVPYGISRFLVDGFEADKLIANQVVGNLYSTINMEEHFLRSIDDRYWCHYIGHSLLRSIPFLKSYRIQKTDENRNLRVGKWGTSESGHFSTSFGTDKSSVIVTSKKGGILSIVTKNLIHTDFGWYAHTGLKPKSQLLITHWWSDKWIIESDETKVQIVGKMLKHREGNSTPLKHMLLRIASLTLGHRIITFLKSMLIFRKRLSDVQFRRTITILNDRIVLEDEFKGLPQKYQLVKAPRSSKRHVASADSGHSEDLCISKELLLSESRETGENCIKIVRAYKV